MTLRDENAMDSRSRASQVRVIVSSNGEFEIVVDCGQPKSSRPSPMVGLSTVRKFIRDLVVNICASLTMMML